MGWIKMKLEFWILTLGWLVGIVHNLQQLGECGLEKLIFVLALCTVPKNRLSYGNHKLPQL